jgi:hypothetical protein
VPVFNTPDIKSVFGGNDGVTIKTDKQGLVRELEYIALPGTVFDIIEETETDGHKILRVRTDSYNYDPKLYVDSRFTELVTNKPVLLPSALPGMKHIYDFLDKAIGAVYIWGGNYINGIGKMLEYYPPKGNISAHTKKLWTFEGCDCSGLIYEATNGYTERNTLRLIYSGEAVDIEGLDAKQLKTKLRPLDMLVWKGHVIYVYDDTDAIQSALSKGGVVKTPLLETLESLMEKRIPVNDYNSSDRERFVVRRWYK